MKRKQKLISLVLTICMMVSMMAGCGSTATTNQAAADTATTASATKTFTDSAGRQVEIPTNITRIACSGSLAQIVLFALAPEMIVGLSGKWDASAEQYIDTKYYNLPVLGQFYGKGDLNLEEVANADPQVIIDVGESKDTMVQDMDSIQNQVGIPTIHIDATTATMGDAYRTLGELLGKQAEGTQLADYCDSVYKNTQNILNKVGTDKKIKVLYCTGKDGLSVLAKGSFQSETIDLLSNNQAVVDNVSSSGNGNTVNMEQLLLWNPDVILFAPGSIYSTVANDPGWQQLKAIKNGTYYEVPNGPYNWMGTPPSVNRYMGMIWMSQLLYPEAANYNMKEETKKYYKLFYHTDLTDAQYKSLVGNSILKANK